MKVKLEMTGYLVEVSIGRQVVPAMVWEGTNERGDEVHAFITHMVPKVTGSDANELYIKLRQAARQDGTAGTLFRTLL